MTKQQKQDLRFWQFFACAIVLILPFIEWHEIRPAALASVAMMVGGYFGLLLGVVLWGAYGDQ